VAELALLVAMRSSWLSRGPLHAPSQCICITVGKVSTPGLVAVLSSPDAAGASLGAPQDEVESALTDRYQTTVPQPVRRALGLRKRDRIRYSFRANGEVVLQRVSPDPIEEDPALAPFLALLEQDIASHPERLQPIGADLVRRLQDLVGAIEVDLDEALPDDA
jgi:antitoxin PrlF